MPKNRELMHLYVWEDSLGFNTYGVMFALAHDVGEARWHIRRTYHQDADRQSRFAVLYALAPEAAKKWDRRRFEEDLRKEPLVITEPRGFLLWGGG